MNLLIDEKWRIYPAGLNFNNGYYSFLNNKLVAHSYERFETSVMEVELYSW
jgi:hypothetical protein